MLWSSSPTTNGAAPNDTSSTSRSCARLRSWYSSTSTCGYRRRYASATRGPLVTDQRRIAELPHELPREDPPLGAAHDSEPCGHPDAPAVRAQPAQRDRMHRAHRMRVRPGEVLDALAHLLGGTIGEGHDQNGRWVHSRGHEPPESLGDDRGLAGARSSDDPDRRRAQRGGFALTRIQARHAGVERPMRTRRMRTRRPRSMPLSRAITVSASNRSWCASAGLDVVTISTPDLSSTASQSRAGSGPISMRKATATRMPRSRPPPGWRRTTVGRILPSLSTGFNSPRIHAPYACTRDEIRRKRTHLGRRDDDLPLARHSAQKCRAPLGVQLRQDVVQQEHWPFTGAPGDERRLGELEAHHRGPLLPLGGVASSVTPVELDEQVVVMRTDRCRPPTQVVAKRLFHSISEVLRGSDVGDFEPFAGRDFSVAFCRVRPQLLDRPGTRAGYVRAVGHELGVPRFQHARRLLAGGDPLEQAFALLEHPPEGGQVARVARLDLHEHLVEEAPALLGPRLDQAEVVGPEERHPEMARQVVDKPADTVDLDDAPYAFAFSVQRDRHLEPATRRLHLGVDAGSGRDRSEQLLVAPRAWRRGQR